MESYSYYLWHNFKSTTTVYNLYTNFSIGFYLFILRSAVQSKTAKKYMALAILVMAVFFVNTLINKNSLFNTYSYMLASTFIISACVYYLFEIFRFASSPNLLKESAFWICTALLFMYVSGFMLLSTANLLENASVEVIRNLKIILKIINYLFYILLCMAFSCRYIFKS